MPKNKLRTPIKWYGGKSKLIKKLLPLLPEHKIYVEVFGGSGALLFAKQPSLVEVYNDIDDNLVNFFRVLQNKRQAKELQRLLTLSLYSRKELNTCSKTYKEGSQTQRAYKFFIASRQAFSGIIGGSWSFAKTCTSRGMAHVVSNYLSAIDEVLPLAIERLKTVQIDNASFQKVIKRYDTAETLFYLDPPYVHRTRKTTDSYKSEMVDKEHEELVDILLKIKGKAIVSGYENPIYKKLKDNGWRKRNFKTVCFAANISASSKSKSMQKRPKRTESVWLSPTPS